jgi:hypothetical protein
MPEVGVEYNSFFFLNSFPPSVYSPVTYSNPSSTSWTAS